jgi:shikimate kinase
MIYLIRKGKSISESLEAVCLRELHDKDNFIIACGGGTPCYYDNMMIMNYSGSFRLVKTRPNR